MYVYMVHHALTFLHPKTHNTTQTQADAKALLGAVVCGDGPGEFRWQPGPLTVAVQR